MSSPISGLRPSVTRTSGAGPGAPIIGELRQDAMDEESNSLASPLRQSPTSQGSVDEAKTGSFDVSSSVKNCHFLAL